jgi:hypothetical protein
VPPGLLPTANPFCDIPTVAAGALESRVFQDTFVSLRRPILIQGYRQWAQLPRLTADQLATEDARFGFSVQVGLIPYAKTYGEASASMKLSGYAQRHLSAHANASTPYVFDAQVYTREPALQALFPTPTALVGPHVVLTQTIVGPEGTGSSPHFHGHAANMLLFGRKQWTLWPARNAFFRVAPAQTLVNESFPAALMRGALRCVQEAGDLLFVPAQMGHAIRNLAPSAAVAFEFFDVGSPRAPAPSQP